MGGFRSAVVVAAVALATAGCVPTQLALIADDDGSSSEVLSGDIRLAGREDGRFMYAADDSADCAGVFGVSIPCRDVLLVCFTDPVTGYRSAVLMPDVYRCGSGSLSLAEACAVQPEYAAFYGCKP